jgi:calcineurin-like phosphoesterase family protein
MRRCGFDAVKVLKLNYNFTQIMMRHAPKHFTDLDADESDILLHGHSHGSPVSPHLGSDSYKLLDIGIDAIKTIRPVSISEVFTFFEGKSA